MHEMCIFSRPMSAAETLAFGKANINPSVTLCANNSMRQKRTFF